ncbi:MAG: hypothetical protein HYZ53_06950 [Planctomycetes bacterium]|nr:hypothetical protein [Planctomycetota bacterium]
MTAGDQTDHRCLLLPLARCGECDRWARVLPIELLPRKTYALPVIETAARCYTSPDPCGPGLRPTVRRLGKFAPVHSTLHHWTAGLGERALD